MSRIEALLRKTIGLEPESLGPRAVERAVRTRMKSLGLSSLDDYEHLLERSGAELDELIELVVVTETWFFRDPALIGAFVCHVCEQWLPAHPAAVLRVLSLPCASGEEPYTLVMALLNAGVAPERFQIDAMDISGSALARAKRGVYGCNSFRGKGLVLCAPYFAPSKEGLVLDPAVRRRVRFSRGNLFSNDFLPGHACYDYIFCRNLLIYFDRPTQRKAIERIEPLLAASGILFVGPVEQPIVLNAGWVNAHLSKVAACVAPGARAVPGSQRPRKQVGSPIFSPGTTSILERCEPGTARAPEAVSRCTLPDLETAHRLADAGQLNEAAAICEAHLRRNPLSAQAHYLLGLVREASGDASAVDCYRKALYIKPDHYESLLQMALSCQKNGEPTRARAFRGRAQRLKTKA